VAHTLLRFPFGSAGTQSCKTVALSSFEGADKFRLAICSEERQNLAEPLFETCQQTLASNTSGCWHLARFHRGLGSNAVRPAPLGKLAGGEPTSDASNYSVDPVFQL